MHRTTQNMNTISALERSLQNCSLNRSSSSSSTSTHRQGNNGVDRSDTTVESHEHNTTNHDTAAMLELNSHIALPYQWEQCLDLESGEIYYINWETGMKEKEDPRKIESFSENYYCEEEEEEEEENSTYSSDDSSSVSSPSQDYHGIDDVQGENTLIVAGCKSCLMYFMLPKWVHVCPKCSGFLLHFDRFKNGSL